METPHQTPNDSNDNAAKKKMEKRVKNLFAEQDPPAYVSNIEVDAMKARIKELEMELAGQQKETEPAPVLPENEIVPQPSQPSQPTQLPQPVLLSREEVVQAEVSPSNVGRQKRIVLWLIGICTIVDLALSIYLMSSVDSVRQGQFDLTATLFLSISAVVLISNVFAYQLARRDRRSLGIGLVYFVGTLIPSISSTFIFQGFSFIGMSYIILMTLAVVSLDLPKNFKRWTVIAAVVSVFFSIGVEYWSPSFRVDTDVISGLGVISNIFIGITLLGLVVFFVRRTASGNINTKLVTTFVAVAVLSMGVVAFQSDRSLRSNLKSDIVNSQAFLAKSQGLQIGQAITSQYDKLKGLASVRAVQEGTEAANLDESRPRDVTQIEQLNLAWREAIKTDNVSDPLAIAVLYSPLSTQLRRFQETFPENVEILITDEKGFSIAATTLPSSYYQADALWWRTAHTDGQYIGQPIFDPATNSVALDMAIPIYSYTTKEFVGVMRTTVDFSVLTDLLIEGLHGQTGYSIIHQPNNQQIKLQVLEDGTYKVVQGFASDDLQSFVDSQITSQEFSLDGVPVLASLAPVTSNVSALSNNSTTALDALEWSVVVVQETDEALQPVNIQARNNLLLALLIIIIVIAVSYFLAGFISNPIVRLTAVANQIASGDLTARAESETNDEIGTLAGTFNRMTSQLREILLGLEERVANRTHDLELANEVGKTVASKVDNLNELLSDAVEMIRARFNLYYTQVYITDSSQQTIILRAGTGQVGQQLLSRNHHLMINGASLNGRAVSEKQTVLVSSTLNDPTFLPNPLLPNTRSEMAVPLIAGDRIVGVLDMQSENAEALNTENQPAFEAMAGQLAIAIQNATLFEQMNEARKLVEEQTSRLTSSGWRDFLDAIERSETIGYEFDQNSVQPLTDMQATSENALTIPIEVSGARIGEVQLADPNARSWTAEETEVVQTVISRVSQHIDALRLLAQAEQYRHEAEQVSRRLTSEGWSEYFRTRKEIADGFHYNQEQVQPLNGNGKYISTKPVLDYPLTVRDEPIGVMMVNPQEGTESQAYELISAVAEQLSDHIENLRLLEQAEQRRLELETVATVASTVSTVLDPDKLLQAVVDMTKERFALYHAHIYLVDDEWNALLLAAGAGDAGRKMVAQQHSIPMDAEQSLVARASRDRKTVIANDVRSNPDFLPNPLLPYTRAEMAIPMIVGSNVLGVFDVQSDKSGGFAKEDADIYTTLASQVAVALQNARLYVEQAATVTQLRELDRLKSAFLANMSHELRTPLNSILGFTDVMLEGLDGDLTDYMDNDLRLIQKNGRHLLHLINDVLDMAKIESGRMNLHPENFNIHELLDEVTSITAPLASEKNLSLFIDESSDKNLNVYADNTRLRQVMINLVNNSIKFTEQGKISLSAQTLDSARILISVKDTGIGIPQDHLEAVFQEFTQVDTTTTRKAGGTGLGLPISRRLIEMHGGRLWAESTGVNGEGSTFFVELPLEAQVSDVIEKEEK